jgi:hypothetical protein
VREATIRAYQIQVATYLMALLVDRSGSGLDLDGIWRRQGLTGELLALLKTWVQPVLAAITTSAADRNVTQWCKKRECWDAVRQLAVPMPIPLPSELAKRGAGAPGTTTEPDDTVTPADLENIAACKRLDGPTWLRISGLGRGLGLQTLQIGIALTLSGYAASGWEKNPSPKQAKQAVKIMRLPKIQELIDGNLNKIP